MKIFSTPILTALLLASLLSSCLKDDVDVSVAHYTPEEYQLLQQNLDLPEFRHRYSVDLAAHLRDRGAQPPAIHDAKATLGRVLFYDTKLSLTEETSCASCHDQRLAFSDDKAFSEGINGQVTKRNSLPLAATANFSSSYESGPNNFGASIGFFWDERASTISGQSELTIQDDIEMGMDLDELTVRLAQEDYYQVLFRRAYGDDAVTKDRILSAIEEFVNSFVSTNSRFDEGMNLAGPFSTEFPNFTDLENQGMALFAQNCASCHPADMSTPSGINVANNGLDLVYTDQGMGERFPGTDAFNGVFKVPFLRNIELTAPYMHDGRFDTLEEVIDHYSTGIQNHPNLSPQLKDLSGEPVRFNFNAEEKAALVAFLKTVTDNSFAEDVRYSDPFRK